MVLFKERRGQSLVEVGQTHLNLIDGLKTTRLCEIHIRILFITTEKYGDILVLVKFENNWMIGLGNHVHYAPSLYLNSIRWIRRV